MFCIRSKKTDFIDSNGNVVTAYRTNKFTKMWHGMIGKNQNDDEYETNEPLGDLAHDEDDPNHHDSPGSSSLSSSSHIFNKNNSNPVSSSNNNPTRSNDLLLNEEDKYYDEDGNELNAKMY